MTDSLYSLFLPPQGFMGDFGLFCGFTAAPDILAQIKRRFSPEVTRPALAAFIHPTVNAISDVPGLAWMWMTPNPRDYRLLHAKVALLGFRNRDADRYMIRLAVSTGNWTQDPLTNSIDMFWSINLDLSGRIDLQAVADIRAAWAMFDWLRARADTSLIDRDYDGLRPEGLLKAAIEGLAASDRQPRFIDSRDAPLSTQVIARLAKGPRLNRLVIGSGFFESENTNDESVPERLRRDLVKNRSFDPEGLGYLTLNPEACQGLASRAEALNGWTLCRPQAPHHPADAKLHAKFIAMAKEGESGEGRLYIGSGNLSRIGFETSARAGGNLEAGVVFETGKLPWHAGKQDDIRKHLPTDFDSIVQIGTLAPGSDFQRPAELDSLPPVTFLIWAHDGLSAPGDKQVKVIQDDKVVTTPCPWPGPPPAIVTTAEGGWRLPVLAEGVLVARRPRDMTIEDILAGLGSFPYPLEGEPLEESGADEQAGGAQSEARQDKGGATLPSVYPIRRMMQLLVRLGEAQARVDLRDWPRWCRELRQDLLAITKVESRTIAFFANAQSNPLPALLDPRMLPKGADPATLGAALQDVSRTWALADYPSLWAMEAA